MTHQIRKIIHWQHLVLVCRCGALLLQPAKLNSFSSAWRLYCTWMARILDDVIDSSSATARKCTLPPSRSACNEWMSGQNRGGMLNGVAFFTLVESSWCNLLPFFVIICSICAPLWRGRRDTAKVLNWNRRGGRLLLNSVSNLLFNYGFLRHHSGAVWKIRQKS